jgi:phosphomannomutase
LNKNWSKLQNGTDIRGVALPGIPGENVNLTPDVCHIIAKSFLIWLSGKKEKKPSDLKISVGMDSRLSGPDLKSGIIMGLSSQGAAVYDCSLSSTPAMFMTTVLDDYKYDGAIMITASHLPFNRNGLKFFTEKGGLEKEDIIEILNICEKQHIENISKGKLENIDFISHYAEGLVNFMRREISSKKDYEKPFTGLKIIVDAGNGAGGFFADKVLIPLGADTRGSQFLNPDGSFPNHIPNPENIEAMESIREAVINNKADLGIIFDTDVDRAAAVDKKGEELNRNNLIALISAIILEKSPGAAIVTDSITSTGRKEVIERKGGIHHRFKRGYKNVINEAIRLNSLGQNAELAIETSGHAALKENYFLDDGAYLISKILIKMAQLKEEGKEIESLIKDLKIPLESLEFRMKINKEDFKEYGNLVIKDLEEYSKEKPDFNIEPNNYEGIRVSFNKENGDGWFLLRLSLHDPIIPLNIESDSTGGALEITRKLYSFLKRYDALDIKAIEDYLK